jgi:hypothetical protein
MTPGFKTLFVYWLPMPVIGVLNGIFRGLVIIQFMSEFHAKQVSSVLLIALLFFYTKIVFGHLSIHTKSHAWLTGLTWMLLTIVFEFVLGYGVLKHSLASIFSEYNLAAGNLWTLVLLGIATLPFVHFMLRRNTIAAK